MSTTGGGKKKPAAKRKPAAKKTTTKRKANPALMKPWKVTGPLAEVIGDKPLPRGQVTKKVWDYIKKHDLQDKKDRRMINADAKLKKVFGGKSKVSMFEMTKHTSKWLKKIE